MTDLKYSFLGLSCNYETPEQRRVPFVCYQSTSMLLRASWFGVHWMSRRLEVYAVTDLVGRAPHLL